MQDMIDQATAWIAGAWEGGVALSAGWNWWATLFDAYAWTSIGAVLTPFLLLVIVGMFWAITRLHLQG